MHPNQLTHINLIYIYIYICVCMYVHIYIYDIDKSHPITAEPHSCKRIVLSSYATTIVCGVVG